MIKIQREGFSNKNGRIEFDPDDPNYLYKKSQQVSYADFFETVTVNGHRVLSLATAKYGDNTKEIFRKIKNGVEPEEIGKFLDFVSDHIKFLVEKIKADYIISLPSSSKFLSSFMNILSERTEIPTADFLNIKKNKINELKFNKRSLLLDGIDRDEMYDLKMKVEKAIRYQIEDGEDYLEAKRFPKTLLPLVTNFFSVTGETSRLNGKNVLVIDDNLASGASIKEMVDMLSIQFDCEPTGLVLFKLISSES
jgi:hypothetical protein